MLAALLPLALEALKLWRDHASKTTTADAMENPAIKLAVGTVSLYRAERDRALAAGEVAATSPDVVTDGELINAFELDAIHFRDHAAALLEKYKTTV
jgi:hypothetical protein